MKRKERQISRERKTERREDRKLKIQPTAFLRIPVQSTLDCLIFYNGTADYINGEQYIVSCVRLSIVFIFCVSQSYQLHNSTPSP